MTIQERPCPRCGVHRSFRLWLGRSMCANCKLQWATQISAGTARAPVHFEATPVTTPFTSRELERLRVYRAAIAYGLYTDQSVCAAQETPAAAGNHVEVPQCPTC